MKRVQELLDRISFELFSTKFEIKCFEDKKFGGRVYLQVIYVAKDKNTEFYEEWKGRKWYLSEHMLDDEIVKTAYAACKAAVEHEVMESFRVDDKILFNPHTPFDVLLGVSDIETKRANPEKNKEIIEQFRKEVNIDQLNEEMFLEALEEEYLSDEPKEERIDFHSLNNSNDSEHLFKIYKPALDNRCDEACFYVCTKGGQEAPECIEHYYQKNIIQDELPVPNTPEQSEMFQKAWNDVQVKTEIKPSLEIIYGTPGAIISRREESIDSVNKNRSDLETLKERLIVLQNKKQKLLLLKKEYRQELSEVFDSIKRIKGWIKELE